MRSLIILFGLLCGAHMSHGATLSIVVNQTLSGQDVNGSPMRMTVNTDTEYLHVTFTAPYVEGTNRVHLFLADDNHRITELRFTPSGSALNMMWAPYNPFRSVTSGEAPSFEASTIVAQDKSTWTGTAKVHRDLLPPRITLYNAANVHPTEAKSETLQYGNLYSITNYGIALPDLMVLPRYTAIGARFLFDNDRSYSKEWKTGN